MQLPKLTVAEAVTEALKELAKETVKKVAAFKNDPIINYIHGIIKCAEERREAKNRLWVPRIERDKPPCVKLAEILTAQRAAGRRKKRSYHTRNRRKRKWQ